MTDPWNPPDATYGTSPPGPPPAGGPAHPPSGGPGYPAAPGPMWPVQGGPYPGGHPGVVPPAPPRPGRLSAAVNLMWIGALVSLLNMLSTFLFLDDIREGVEEQLTENGQRTSESTIDAAVTIGVIAGVVIGLITVGLWAWMAVMNSKGRSWARVVATVFGGLGILFALIGLAGGGFGAETTPVSLASSAINLLLAIAILVLLWSKQNASYYQANS